MAHIDRRGNEPADHWQPYKWNHPPCCACQELFPDRKRIKSNLVEILYSLKSRNVIKIITSQKSLLKNLGPSLLTIGW